MLENFFEDEEFLDKYLNSDKEKAIDIIIPVLNTSVFFKRNLISFYRELNVNRILIWDGGCNDNTLEVTKFFPRVKILDHTKMTSLGGSIVDLIKNVETRFFAYMHADVWLYMLFWKGKINLNNIYEKNQTIDEFLNKFNLKNL